MKGAGVRVMMSERVQCRDNGEQRRPAGTNKLLGEKGDVLQSEIADDSLAQVIDVSISEMKVRYKAQAFFQAGKNGELSIEGIFSEK